MKKIYQIALFLLGLGAALIIGATIAFILPEKAFYRDYEDKLIDNAYIFVYKNDVIWSYGDSTIESVTKENGNQTLVLAYKNPGGKGASYRNALVISENSAMMNDQQYVEMSPMNIFQPALYKNPLVYFMTILRMR